MNYSYKEIKETTLDLNTKKILGTDLIQWRGVKKTTLNGIEEIVNGCGITSKKIIEEHSVPEFPTNKIYSPNLYNNYAFVVKLSKEKYEKIMYGDMFVYDGNVFEEVNENNIENDNYMTVLWNPASYKLTDIYHNFISIPIHMDYTTTLLTNANYNLDIVLEELKKSPYVLKKEELEIDNIPYYNATHYEDKCIEFLCLVDNKTYASLQEYDSYTISKKIINEIILKGKGLK